MDIHYQSTRNPKESISASRAILQGLSPDGGLYVPEVIPALPFSLQDMRGKTYREIAFPILRAFLTDYTEAELQDCINKAYDEKFDVPEIAPVVKVGNAFYIELFHGKTIAFKDMALSILPHLLTAAAKKNHTQKEIVILTATSGDTGKAAMAGFANVPGTRIIVFYPKGGVSQIQERQMITQQGDNTFVVGIEGNFDDAQNGVKAMSTNPALLEAMQGANLRFSSANSINVGRLVPQIVYYVAAYIRLLEAGVLQENEKINITVPTGNFGNILAAWYAREMGLPVHKLICASNRNRVLYDFFQTGIYNKNRAFHLTSSPSMDILISSNLERMIYTASGRDAVQTAAFMRQLQETGEYTVTDAMRAALADFVPGYATEEETAYAIHETFRRFGYVEDPHTAVADFVYQKYRETTGDTTPTLLASTASPFKFAGDVLPALDETYTSVRDVQEMFSLLSRLSGRPVPAAVARLFEDEVRHTRVCATADMEKTVREILHL